MSYVLKIKTSAKKELKRLPKNVLVKIKKIFEKLSENPRLKGVIKLKGTDSDIYRIRVGNYRIVYEIRDNTLVIIVISIAHRREIYTKKNTARGR